MTIAPPAWTSRAACLGVDIDLFFPTRGRTSTPALAICQRCPVKQQCLDFAVQHEDGHPTYIHGVYGGTTADQRMERIGVSRTIRPTGRRSRQGRPDLQEIREWALSVGLRCSDMGPIPRAVREAYDAAHPTDHGNPAA